MTKHANNKTKRSTRKQTRLKTLGSMEDEVITTVPAESSVKNDRIKSAIENGTQSILPSDTTKGHYLTKFEHRGKEGPLVVYAEDKRIQNEFGHFTVITSFKPSDSLRNQLFFASSTASSNTGNASSISSPGLPIKEYRDRSMKDDMQETARNNGDRVRQKHRQPNSFEGLVTHYKSRQEKYRRLLGDDSLYLFQKIDHLCQTKSKGNSPKKSEKRPQKERTQDLQVLPVLPKVKVDQISDEPMNGKTKRKSDYDQFSKQKLQPKLPYLKVPRYSKL